MQRSLKGTTLALVLVALVAMKHAVLGFCLCSEHFFLGACNCEQAAVAPTCGCCEDAPADPCGDCGITVTVDIDDFLWGAASFDPKVPASTPLALPHTPFAGFTRGTDLVSSAMPIRGSPPGTPPLYLLTSVLRL